MSWFCFLNRGEDSKIVARCAIIHSAGGVTRFLWSIWSMRVLSTRFVLSSCNSLERGLVFRAFWE